jgi:hypothetical protein
MTLTVKDIELAVEALKDNSTEKYALQMSPESVKLAESRPDIFEKVGDSYRIKVEAL